MSDDYRQILNAMAAYAYAVDKSDWDIIKRAYHPGTRHINAGGDVIEGVEKFIAYRRSKEPHELRELVHTTSNALVDIDGDRARSTSNWSYLGRTAPDAEWKILSLGAYEDEFVRLDVGWRFAQRRIISFRNRDARTWAELIAEDKQS